MSDASKPNLPVAPKAAGVASGAGGGNGGARANPHAGHAHGVDDAGHHGSFADVATKRDLFWQNLVREMLMGLAVTAESRRYQIIAELQTKRGQMKVDGATITTSPELTPRGQGGDGAGEDGEEDALGPGSHPEMPLDGRVAVLTKGGERIPVADVRPLLACSVPWTPAEKALSIDVQCTIFQVVAPSGEVFTLPLHEIRAVHAISEELMEKLQDAARHQGGGIRRRGTIADGDEPFGFAAFTSLAQSEAKRKP